MTEPVNGGNPANVNNQDNGGGADPKNNPSNAANPSAPTNKPGENAFDEKVFDDPRLWTHPRFKSLNERAKKADELEQRAKAAEEKRLADNKKFEELAALREKERDEVKDRYTQSVQDNRIITEASKIGVVDIEAVLKLVDRSNIRVDDQGNVSGVTEAVAALFASKPYLKGKAGVTIGSPSNPSADANEPKKFKLSQLSDHKFYAEHEKEILEAYAKGLIEDDTH